MIFVLAIVLALTAWRYSTIARRSGIRAALRHLITAIAASCVAGIVFGISARVAMRLLALGLDAPLRLSFSGAFTVIMIFSGLGIVLGLPYPILFRDLFRRNPFVYAMLLTLVTLQPFIQTAAQDLGASIWDIRVIGGTVVASIVMWAPYSVALEASYAGLTRMISARERLRQSRAA